MSKSRRILFPTTVVDNFYENPDKVREFALSLDFKTGDGTWPGKRTDLLHLVDKEFFDYTCKKLMSTFFDFTKTNITWEIKSHFQLIEPYAENKFDTLNSGWIHLDSNYDIVSAVCYLNKEPDPDTGTCIYEPCVEDNFEFYSIIEQESELRKLKYLNGEISDEEYSAALSKHRNRFIETVNVKNRYNRLIAFDSNSWHGVNTYKNDKEPRLTQVFFVSKLETDSEPPYIRLNRITL